MLRAVARGRCETRGLPASALTIEVCAGVRRTRAELRAGQIPRRGYAKRVCFTVDARVVVITTHSRRTKHRRVSIARRDDDSEGLGTIL